MGNAPVSAPVESYDDAFFWAGARRGELLIQRCTGCGELRHPPAPMCSNCQSLGWDTLRSAGRGTVYSWVLSHHPTQPDSEPRLVILVDLDEGVRLVSNLLGLAIDDVVPGLLVEVAFVDHGTFTLPQFIAAGAASRSASGATHGTAG